MESTEFAKNLHLNGLWIFPELRANHYRHFHKFIPAIYLYTCSLQQCEAARWLFTFLIISRNMTLTSYNWSLRKKCSIKTVSSFCKDCLSVMLRVRVHGSVYIIRLTLGVSISAALFFDNGIQFATALGLALHSIPPFQRPYELRRKANTYFIMHPFTIPRNAICRGFSKSSRNLDFVHSSLLSIPLCRCGPWGVAVVSFQLHTLGWPMRPAQKAWCQSWEGGSERLGVFKNAEKTAKKMKKLWFSIDLLE